MQKAEKQCLEETSPCWGFSLSYHMIQYDMLRHDMMCNMHIDNVVKYNVSAESDIVQCTCCSYHLTNGTCNRHIMDSKFM